MLLFVVLGALLAAPPPAARTGDALTMTRDINAERRSRGYGTLHIDAALSAVAFEHALEMARHDYFGHLTLAGLSPFARLRAAHLRFRYAGEDLEFDRNIRAAERALWHSPPHRRNALQYVFTRIGVAAVHAPRGEFFVEEFSD